MASPLFDMLAALAQDPDLRLKLKEDPDYVMDQCGLTDEATRTLIRDSVAECKLSDDFLKVVSDEVHEKFTVQYESGEGAVQFIIPC